MTHFNKEMHKRAPSSNEYYSDFKTKESGTNPRFEVEEGQTINQK